MRISASSRASILSTLWCVLLCAHGAAQAATQISNMGTANGPTQAVVSATSYQAQPFRTGAIPQAYRYVSFRLNMGGPLNTAGRFFLAIYSGVDRPATMVPDGLLEGPSNPGSGQQIFSGSEALVLLPNTTYWLVAGVSGGAGQYRWNTVSTATYQTTLWSPDNRVATSSNAGSTWTTTTTTTPLKFRADAEVRDLVNAFQKVQFFEQTSAAGATSPESLVPYAFFASTDLDLPRVLTHPSGATTAFTNGDSLFRTFPTRTDLDAVYPNGTYQLSIAGASPTSFVLGSNYPPQPQAVNGVWSAEMMIVNGTQDNRIVVNPFPGYATAGVGGRVELRVFGLTDDVEVQEVASTLVLDGEPATLTAPTELSIPAGTLTNGRVYFCELIFNTFFSHGFAAAPPGNLVLGAASSATGFFIAARAPGSTTPPPVITSSPQSQSGVAGSSATFTVGVTVNGSPQLTDVHFEWQFNNWDISHGDPKYDFSSDNKTLTVNNLTAADAGVYSVYVANTGGIARSAPATLTLQSAPQFTRQPLDVVAETGLNGSFSVGVSGSPVPMLQWFSRAGTGAWAPLENGKLYQGVTETVLSINAVTSAQNNLQYQARATSSLGTIESAIVTLRVSTPDSSIRIEGQPQSVVARAGQSVTLSVSAAGPGALTYQWRKDGATISGATASSLTLNTVSGSDSGAYSALVRGATGGSATSNSALVTVAGAIDATFDPRGGSNGEVTQTIALRDGGFLMAGSFTSISGVFRAGVAKIRRDGSADSSFDPGRGANGVVQAIAEVEDGKFLLVGQFDRFNDVAAQGVVRLLPSGLPDPSFVPDLPVPPVGSGAAVAPLERFQYSAISLNGGRYLLGGKSGIVALGVTGAQVPQLFLPSDGAVYAMVQQFDGGVIVGGDFLALGGFTRARLARLLPDLRVDSAFTVGTGPNAIVQALQRSPDGAIYVIGKFTQFNGTPRPAGIARISPKGVLDTRFNPDLAPVTVSTGSSLTQAAGIRPAVGRLDAIRAGRALGNGGLIVSAGPTSAQSVQAIDPGGELSTVVSVPVSGSANTLSLTSDGDIAAGGSYTAIAGASSSNVAVLTDASDGCRLTNLSCRGRISGESVRLILGFVITGPDAMRVLVRGVGPTLQAFGLTTALSQPKLSLYDGAGNVVAENTSWSGGPDPDGLRLAMAQAGAFSLSSSNDTALVMNLLPGSYTAHITGRSGTQGLALGEIYAVDNGRSRLVNSSVRGEAGIGPDALVPGFTVTGGARLVLTRAIGPTLAVFGVPGSLQQPSLEFRKLSGELLATNIGWGTGFDPAALQARSAQVGAFPLPIGSSDSAVLQGLAQGSYTVTVSGANGAIGEALVEVYDANGADLPPP